MTDDLAQWLGARLDAREQTARAAIPDGGTGVWPWHCPHEGIIGPIPIDHDLCARFDDLCARLDGPEMTIYDEGGHSVEQAKHIAAHDPAWVLADVAAKRKLIELHSLNEYYFNATGRKNRDCITCDGERSEYFGYPCPTLKALAATERGAPGWRTEWEL